MSPVIIIGAGRSGTNLLRDIVTQLPGFGTWPCDEINYIWRHGNTREPTDEFAPEFATDQVQAYIRQAFEKIARHRHIAHVVEKTCANSLRVAFVYRIFPDARFIYIIRDGRDVVASALKRWKASLDIGYILRKARFVPAGDLPYYASRYLWNRLYRILPGKQRLAFWGPRFSGMQEMLRSSSLSAVCAMQWARCVEKADSDFKQINASRLHRIRYEEFVTHPGEGLQALAEFLHASLTENDVSRVVKQISSGNIGKWTGSLDENAVNAITPFIAPMMKQHEYW